MTAFTVQIISDTVCPWCYIGYRRLSKARDLYQKTYPGGSKDTFTIEWKPYYLNPDAPLVGESMHDRMVNRMGLERATNAQKHMTALGRGEGVEIGYGGKTGNTHLSHRLLHYAKSISLDKQTEVALELFRLHFSEDGDITQMSLMLDAARNCGLDVEDVQRYLESGAGAGEVDAEAADVRAEGVKGVPRFRICGGGEVYEVDGAGDTMEFFEILMKIKGDPSVAES